MQSGDKRTRVVYTGAMRFTVNLSDATVAKIDQQARAEGRSRANMIRRLLGDLDEAPAVKTSKPKQPTINSNAEARPVSDIINIIRPVVVSPEPPDNSSQPAAAAASQPARAASSRPGFVSFPKPKDSKRR